MAKTVTPEPRNTARLLLHLERGHLTAETAVQWATQALIDDFDTPALRRLAGATPRLTSSDEIEPEVKRALDELDIVRPHHLDLLRRYETETAEAIVDGRLSPLAGLADLYQNVVLDSGYDWRFLPWCYLDDGLDPYHLDDYSPIPKAALVPSILRYAQEVRDSSPDVASLAQSLHRDPARDWASSLRGRLRAAARRRGEPAGPSLPAFSAGLQAWRARGRLLTVRGMEVFCIDEGSGADTLLLLHGFPTSSHDWSRVWDAFAARRRVIALDLPGFGFSAKPASYSYSLLEQADVVELVLRELGVARAHVIAHDMGTSVATELLARRETGLLHFAIDRLVLMNGSVHAELARLTPAQKLLRRRWFGPLFARVASGTTYRLQLRRILGRNDGVSDQDLADQFALIRHRDGHLRLPAIIGYYGERTRFRERWIGALERLDLPALILWGRLDPVAVPAIAEALAAETPGAQLVWMDELGHYPQLEDFQRVVMEVERFLASG